MLLPLPHSASPEVLPNLIRANSSQGSARPSNSRSQVDAERERPFASGLRESRDKVESEKSAAGGARVTRKSGSGQADRHLSVKDDLREHNSGEALQDSSGARVIREATSMSHTVAAQEQSKAALSENIFAEQYVSGQVKFESGPQSAVQSLLFSESPFVMHGAVSQTRGSFPVSELAGLIPEQLRSSESDSSARVDAALARVVVETKEQLSGTHIKAQALNTAIVQGAVPSYKIAATASQPDIRELFQSFGIEQADLSERGDKSEQVSKSATGDLRTLTLAPNIRQLLTTFKQTTRGDTNESGDHLVENESLVSKEQQIVGAQNNRSGLRINGLPNAGVQSGTAGATPDGMLLNGSVDAQTAQFEEFSAQVAEGVKGGQEKVSEANPRSAGASQLRAGFILPDRFGQTLRSGVKSITLQITPKHLGPAQLRVNVINNNVSGTLFVESHAAKAAVEVSIEQLAQRLEDEGLSLDRLDVEVSERDREEFGAERRDADERANSRARYEAENMTVETPIDVQTFERRSIVTSSRIDAVV